MARACCLVGVAPQDISRLGAAVGEAMLNVETSVALLDVVMLNALAPDLLVIDIDSLTTDPLEALRQLRFVLPKCILAVYTSTLKHALLRECHSAGANCLLSRSSSEAELTIGLRRALWSGCFTDPRFLA
jgi:DNA-binding NarL/FixJ family response regulator